MSNHVDEMIRAAIRNGEMDNLPHKGEPLPLDDDSDVPPELRMTYRILKNAGMVPDEVQAMKDIARMQGELRDATTEADKTELLEKIRSAQAILQAKLEKMRNMRHS